MFKFLPKLASTLKLNLFHGNMYLSSSDFSSSRKHRHVDIEDNEATSLAFSNVKIATCNLNQWVLDFQGNKRRILESLKIAKQEDCTYRVGPELEIPGYTCEDHFYELDTVKHSWEVLAEILTTELTNGMVCDIGMPVLHRDVLYNARVIVKDRQILYIRPKSILCDDGNYRETRWFTAWKKKNLEEYNLPDYIKRANGQKSNPPIGIAIMKFQDTEVGHEICEELWQPGSPHIMMGLDGAEIIVNSSGSHFALGRIKERLELVKGATTKGGGAYVYSNLIGCDGSRLYFDGCSMVAANGKFLNIGKRFSFREVEVVTTTLDLDSVREEKIALKSRCGEAANIETPFPRVNINFRLCQSKEKPTEPIDENVFISPEKASEIGLGPAFYLWDYLRRSGACGYFLPLSGGADSTATALIVHSMCSELFQHLEKKHPDHEWVLGELRRVLKDRNYTPKSAKELTGKFLFTCYMASKHSSEETRSRAKRLAEEIGASHLEINIDKITEGFISSISPAIKDQPKFVSQGGTMSEDIALQNLQARSRMVLSYLLTQLIPSQHNLPSFLLVLAAGNLDECLRGYLTKYDCSSADINPIGGFSKNDLRRFLEHYHQKTGLKTILEVIKATPTAELRPISKEGLVQKDEDEMGMSYAELSVFGTLRKNFMFGPVAMFMKLVQTWSNLPPEEVAIKVKRFFKFYAINRHKMTTITPSIHGEKYGCDDNRYDLRPFLYNSNWDYQFQRIDQMVETLKRSNKKKIENI